MERDGAVVLAPRVAHSELRYSSPRPAITRETGRNKITFGTGSLSGSLLLGLRYAAPLYDGSMINAAVTGDRKKKKKKTNDL